MILNFYQSGGTGRTEPIAVELKSNRVGLGWEDQTKKKLDAYRKQVQKARDEFDPAKFRSQQSSLRNEKLEAGDLRKSQKVCHNLDTNKV